MIRAIFVCMVIIFDISIITRIMIRVRTEPSSLARDDRPFAYQLHS